MTEEKKTLTAAEAIKNMQEAAKEFANEFAKLSEKEKEEWVEAQQYSRLHIGVTQNL